MIVHFQYRDASNYKASFIADVIGKEYKVNDEEHLENLGQVAEEFIPKIMGFAWNEDDHAVVDVLEILPMDVEGIYDLGQIQWQEKQKLDDQGWLWLEVKQTA